MLHYLTSGRQLSGKIIGVAASLIAMCEDKSVGAFSMKDLRGAGKSLARSVCIGVSCNDRLLLIVSKHAHKTRARLGPRREQYIVKAMKRFVGFSTL